MGWVKGQQIAVHLPMDLQEILDETDCILIKKIRLEKERTAFELILRGNGEVEVYR